MTPKARADTRDRRLHPGPWNPWDTHAANADKRKKKPIQTETRVAVCNASAKERNMGEMCTGRLCTGKENTSLLCICAGSEDGVAMRIPEPWASDGNVRKMRDTPSPRVGGVSWALERLWLRISQA